MNDKYSLKGHSIVVCLFDGFQMMKIFDYSLKLQLNILHQMIGLCNQSIDCTKYDFERVLFHQEFESFQKKLQYVLTNTKYKETEYLSLDSVKVQIIPMLSDILTINFNQLEIENIQSLNISNEFSGIFAHKQLSNIIDKLNDEKNQYTAYLNRLEFTLENLLQSKKNQNDYTNIIHFTTTKELLDSVLSEMDSNNAKKSFEKLGYKQIILVKKDDPFLSDIQYIKEESQDVLKELSTMQIKTIDFYSSNQEVLINSISKYRNGTTNNNASVNLSFKELQAIQEQVHELGWKMK